MEEQAPALCIFCGYAHEDNALFQRLKTALTILIRQDAVSVWHDGDLLPGAQWEHEIERELNTADIILLLISPAFIASDYCWSKEMQWAITRHTTGEARVIPILLKPTPGWETTPLGALQALPTDAKPITSWNSREKALADVVEGLRRAVEAIQKQDRYPVKEYLVHIQTYAYGTLQGERLQKEMPAEGEAFHIAEQWLKTLSRIGVLQKSTEDDQRQKWIATDHQQDCHITIQPNTGRVIDSLTNTLRLADILLTSQHPALLDRLLEAGRVPYRAIQWTLLEDLAIPVLARQIHAKMGRPYFNATLVETAYHVEYRLYESDERRTILDPITVALTSRGPSSPGGPSFPARVALIHDNPPYRGFFRAHKLFSVQKIFAILRGELPYIEMQQLIDGACAPPDMSVG
jgi:hypothetical protein